jgi:hypothetical protein
MWFDQFQSARNPLRFQFKFARLKCVEQFAARGLKLQFTAEIRL